MNSVPLLHALGFVLDGGTERYWPVWAGRSVSVISPSFFFSPGESLLHLMPMFLNGFWRRLRNGLLLAQLSFLLLGFGLYSYHARELFVCLLFFCALFVVLAFSILVAVFACYAGKYLMERVRVVASAPPLPPPVEDLAPTHQSPPPW